MKMTISHIILKYLDAQIDFFSWTKKSESKSDCVCQLLVCCKNCTFPSDNLSAIINCIVWAEIVQ